MEFNATDKPRLGSEKSVHLVNVKLFPTVRTEKLIYATHLMSVDYITFVLP